MSLKSEIQRLAHEFEREASAAFDLWTWLPSRKACERAHGDLAYNFQPSLELLLIEANYYIQLLSPDTDDPPAPTQREWFSCPCDEVDCSESKYAG